MYYFIVKIFMRFDVKSLNNYINFHRFPRYNSTSS